MPPAPVITKVIHTDNLRWMSEQLQTSKRRFDLVFVDPPFNIDQAYNGYTDRMEPVSFRLYIGKLAMACHQMSKSITCLHGPDELAECYLGVAGASSWKRIAWVNWHYRFGQNARSNWIDSRCHCLIYARDPTKYTWNPEDVLVESDRVAYGDKRAEKPGNGKRLPFTIWGVQGDGPNWGRVQGNNKERRPGHPNQLPEVYLARLIKAYTNPGDWILDPCGGSGTTAVVARALRRNCVTLDVSEANCESIRERIKKGAVNV